jgi:hypothetical protein
MNPTGLPQPSNEVHLAKLCRRHFVAHLASVKTNRSSLGPKRLEQRRL